MRRFVATTYRLCAHWIFVLGGDLSKMKAVFNPKNIFHFIQTRHALRAQLSGDDQWPWGRSYPILWDRKEQGGTMQGHYFHQDLYVARAIFKANPDRHGDIGSRTDGFVAHVASFRSIEMLDIRPIVSAVPGIVFRQADLMQLPKDLVGEFDSISSLHAIEHFGLGRYGDPVDAYGYKKAIANVRELLKPGGTFYFSVPIGRQRIEFNGQRVFSVAHLLQVLEGKFAVVGFSYVDDAGDFHPNVELTEEVVRGNCGCTFGCGIFTLKAV